ncbi:unnamed protein product [Blepharisma stoltei]|uniref:EF-hand domain-containing protein n=1 Tax=Blepharisma stoltei TaxID=1481888 RepID=A0AAU9IYJ8_9CILI|nr:unnamed protein product [Blepharisma stoltei]
MINQIRENIESFKKLLDDAFKKVDKRKRGVITPAELKKLLNLFGQFPNDNEIREIVPKITSNKTQNSIRYKDFERYMLEPLLSRQINFEDKNLLLSAFQVIDNLNKGYIPLSDFKKILRDSGILWNESDYKDFIMYDIKESKKFLMYEDYIEFLSSENLNNVNIII